MPGIVGALIDGVLTSSAVIGLLPSVAIRSAVSSNTIGASPALLRSTRPPPKSNGSAGVTRSSLTTSVIAVVISADLIAPGVQSGWSAFSRIADPAMCGDDIEVPAMAWKYSPGGPPGPRLRRTGVLPARICTPGAVMSGLRNWPPGPRDENAAMTSPWASPFAPSVNEPRRTGVSWPGTPGSRCRREVHGRQDPVVVGHRSRPTGGCTGSCRPRRPAATLKPF